MATSITSTTQTARIYPGSTVTVQGLVAVDGTPTDASAITFKWKLGNFGTEKTILPTKTATGTYTASVIPPKEGNLYFRWDTDGALDYAAEGTLSIARSRFKV